MLTINVTAEPIYAKGANQRACHSKHHVIDTEWAKHVNNDAPNNH